MDGPDDTSGSVDRNGQKAQQHEIDTAERLASMGFDVRFLRRSDAGRSPDVEIDGEFWEMKSPIGVSANTIPATIRNAERQCDRLVLDLSRSSRDADLAMSEARRAFERYHRLIEIIVLREVDGQVQQLARWRR